MIAEGEEELLANMQYLFTKATSGFLQSFCDDFRILQIEIPSVGSDVLHNSQVHVRTSIETSQHSHIARRFYEAKLAEILNVTGPGRCGICHHDIPDRSAHLANFHISHPFLCL